MLRYQNTKTGAIVDSPFKLSGDNWKQVKVGGKGSEKKPAAKKPENPDEETDDA